MTPKKKPTGRTLKSGEKVTYQDGVRYLAPGDSLATSLQATDNTLREADAAKTAARLAAVRVKRDSLAAGNAVPDDKRVV